MKKNVMVEFSITWSPQGRLLEDASFYLLNETTSKTKTCYGYQHRYAGGGCWADKTFKLVYNQESILIHDFICEDLNSNVFYIDSLANAFITELSLSLTDKSHFMEIDSTKNEWLAFSSEQDCMILLPERIGDMKSEARNSLTIYTTRSVSFDWTYF